MISAYFDTLSIIASIISPLLRGVGVSDIYSQREDKRYTFLLAQWSIDYLKDIQVAIAQGFHLFPFRTEKLSLVTPMVLRLWESR